MLFHYYKDGHKIYTLEDKKEGYEIHHSHPASFTPEDKLSRYRIVTKEKFNIFPFNS